MLFEIPNVKDSLKNLKLVFSKYVQEPMIIFGFNLFILKNKEKLNILKNLPDSQKTIHYIFNDYEYILPSKKENSIDYALKKKYSVDTDYLFYNIWEIIHELKLKSGSLDIASNNDSALLAFKTFRNNKDTFHKITALNLKKKVDILVCIDELEWYNKNYQEQEISNLLLEEILFSLNSLKENGILILRLYDTYTTFTIKLIQIISNFFEETFFIKPLTSSDANSEKFLVAKKFKGSTGTLDQLKINNKEFIIDIDNLEINEDLVKKIIEMNQTLSDLQYIVINKMYQFILNKNYFGVEYHSQVEEQINCSKKWIKKFLN